MSGSPMSRLMLTAVLCCGALTQARAGQSVWHALDVPRWSAPVATIDPVHRLLVVYGTEDRAGQVYTASLTTPTAWSRREAAGPGPAIPYTACRASDPHSGTLFVCDETQGEDWKFEAVADQWTLLGHGLDRFGSALALDRHRHRLLAFGGQQVAFSHTNWLNSVVTLPSDTAGVWAPLTVSGTPPLARTGSTAVFDDAHDRLLVFGGLQKNGAYVDETWSLRFDVDPPTWEFLAPTAAAPPGRANAIAVVDLEHHRLLITGGSAGGLRTDTWALDMQAAGASWQVLNANSANPVPLGAGGVLDSLTGQWFGAGGTANHPLRELRVWSTRDDTDWSTALSDPAGPPAGITLGAVHDRAGSRFLVVMGSADLSGPTDLWSHGDSPSGIWAKIATYPQHFTLSDAVVLADSANGQMLVVHSGFDTMTVYQTPMANPATLTALLTKGTAPGARSAFGAAIDAARDQLLVFGGVTIDSVQHDVAPDVFALPLRGTAQWSKLAIPGAPAIVGPATRLVCDEARDVLVSIDLHQVQRLSLTSLQWSGTPATPDAGFGFATPPIFDHESDRIVAGYFDSRGYFVDALPLGILQWSTLQTSLDPPAASLGHALVAVPSDHAVWDLSDQGAWVLTRTAAGSPQAAFIQQTLIGDRLNLLWRSSDRSVTIAWIEERIDGGDWLRVTFGGPSDGTDFTCDRELTRPGLYEYRLAVPTDSGIQYMGATSFRANAAPPFVPHAALVRAHHNPTDRALSMDVWDSAGEWQPQDRLELYDIAGRRLNTRALSQTSSWQSIDLGAGLSLHPGVYLVRLALFGRRNIDTRVVVL